MERMLRAEDHMGLVAHIALRYTTLQEGERIEDTEEFADGLVGLTNALKAFDPKMNYKFSTFAWYCIRNAIWAGANKRKNDMHFIPMSSWDDTERETQFEATYDAPLCDKFDTHIKLHEFITPKAGEPEHIARKKKIIHDRFFRGLTLDAIGKELNISKERVRQVEAAALDDLRDQFLEIYSDEACMLCGA